MATVHGRKKDRKARMGTEPLMENIAGRRRRWEDRLAPVMFLLAVLFLVLMAVAIHQVRAAVQNPGEPTTLLAQVVAGCLFALWPVFAVEAVVQFCLGPRERRTWKSLLLCLAIGLFPPVRMGAHSRMRANHIWLPGMGWRELDFDLQKTLERYFSPPMLVMALMILPILAVEYYWAEAIKQNPWLGAAVGVSVGLIWIAFSIEFIIRCSTAEKKLSYTLNHWIDLAVVLLPLLEFLPFLRLLRVTRAMRLQYLVRLGKYYRLYGLAGRGWRGLVALELLHRLVSRSPEAQITRLQSHLDEKKEEIRELEREADYYRRRIEAVKRRCAEQAGECDK